MPAINIYAQSMSSDVRTSTNEIAFCIDGKIRSQNQYFCFTLCYQRVVIGYAQAAFSAPAHIRVGFVVFRWLVPLRFYSSFPV